MIPAIQRMQNPATTADVPGAPCFCFERSALFCKQEGEDKAGNRDNEGNPGCEEPGKGRAGRAKDIVERGDSGEERDEKEEGGRDGEGNKGAEEGAD